MKVKLYTLGCKVNQYETEEITENLLNNGYEITGSDFDADVFIVNSCTVTAESDRKTRQLVRRLKRENPDGAVLLTGCMPQAFPEKARALLQADIITGNRDNVKIPEMLEKYFSDNERLFNVNAHNKGEPFTGNSISDFNERTRAIVKIEDGCDRFCSYCIIPEARGRVRSKPVSQIKSEVKALAEKGFCEIVLVGINLSAYGKDSGESFCEAVFAACGVPEIRRVRLGSLEPDHITDEVIAGLAANEKLCPQFHISLQSGSDNTLKRMNRHYTAEEYLALCEKLRKSFKDCTLTTDIMVGFAGESEEDFKQTLEIVKKAAFEKVHIFPYSIRKGTRAADFDGQIEKRVKQERAARLAREAEKIRIEFFNSQIGKTVEILPESKTNGEYVFGYTANYTPVMAKGPGLISGKEAKVRITSADGEYCYAEAEIQE